MPKRRSGPSVSGLAVIGVAVAVLLASVAIWQWQTGPPRKPIQIPPGDDGYTIAYAEHRINRLMRQYHLPSVAVALIDDQDVVWQAAYGLANVEQKLPATVDTVYKLWSVSKVFTAIETMRLAEDGWVDLDAPLTDALPAFTIGSRFPASEPITIRHILAHRSGLPRNGCFRVADRPATYEVPQDLVASLADCRMAFPVGTRYKYSNIGPDLLGLLIQTRRGESFGRYVEAELLAPIGMTHSAFHSTSIPAQATVAMGYEYYKGDFYPYEQGDIVRLPHGNMSATITDMSAFAQFIFRDGEANGEHLIRPETLRLMYEDQFTGTTDPTPTGLGWKVSYALAPEVLVWHDGGPAEGIGSLVALLPERKLGVVLFANATSFEGSVSAPLAIELLALMLETRYGIVQPAEETPAPVDLDPALLDAYTGRYIAFGQVMEVVLRGDRLKGRIQGMTFDLIPADATQFRISHWLLKLGLADLLKLPIDLQALRLQFLLGDAPGDDVMIINLADISYEMAPRYPDASEVPALWDALSGDYDRVARLPSGAVGTEVLGRTRIWVEDNVLRMAGVVGPLLPISDTDLIILSGPFLGETMVYDPGTGTLTHQDIAYIPVR